MKEYINPFDYGTHILQSLQKGILLTTMAQGRVNTMTISWGMLGRDWNTPIFITLVRTNRLTRSYLDANPEFTINIPIGTYDKTITGIAGTKSGREIDKVSALGLILQAGEKVSVPAIRQFPMTLECKVIYRQPQEASLIPPEIAAANHPQHIPSNVPGINKDFHIAYYGAIVSSYILG